jgi:hypothetical protein
VIIIQPGLNDGKKDEWEKREMRGEEDGERVNNEAE